VLRSCISFFIGCWFNEVSACLKPSENSELKRIRAAWLVTGRGEPIRGGSVVTRAGRVVGVEKNSTGPVDIEFEQHVLMPGLINAHTHLEFSGLEQPLSASGGFSEWVGRVIAYRQSLLNTDSMGSVQPSEVRVTSVLRGAGEVMETGSVAVVDIATEPYPLDRLRSWRGEFGALEYWGVGEVLGWRTERVEAFRRWYLTMTAEGNSNEFGSSIDSSDSAVLNWGISPHAPYSTSPRLIQWAIERSRVEKRLLAMHLGETPEEMEWLANRSGPFADLLIRMGIGEVPMLSQWKSAADYLKQLSRGWRVLVVHGNYLPAESWEILSEHREHMSLVYCPRTHRHFGHAAYPLGALKAAGVRVVVGTDSRASNPDLNIWGELQAIAGGSSGLSPGEILALGTSEGAAALGISNRLGAIEVGRVSRWVVAPMRNSGSGAEQPSALWDQLFDPHQVGKPVALWL
jgi:aminodeoxyfutalosine deaminase